MPFSFRASLAALLCSVQPFLSGEPFRGTPVSVPGVIQAEDFDRGGLGKSFFFNSTNRTVNWYRLEPSPIETVTGDGYTGRVLTVRASEWVEYSIQVEECGLYDLNVREVHSGIDSGLTIEVDGVVLAQARTLGFSWEAMDLRLTWLEGNLARWLPLRAGLHTLRLRLADYTPYSDYDMPLARIDSINLTLQPGPNPVELIGSTSSGFLDGAAPQFSSNITGIDYDAAGRVYVADAGNLRIRRIGLDGSVETIAGTGEAGYQDGPGASARFLNLDAWRSLAVDDAGAVYVLDHDLNSNICRFRRISPEGEVDTIYERPAPHVLTPNLLSMTTINELRFVEQTTTVWALSPDGASASLVQRSQGIMDMTAGHSASRALSEDLFFKPSTTLQQISLITGAQWTVLHQFRYPTGESFQGLALGPHSDVCYSVEGGRVRGVHQVNFTGERIFRSVFPMIPMAMDSSNRVIGLSVARRCQIAILSSEPGLVLASFTPGGGVIGMDPAGPYVPGTVVEVTAQPNPGWDFVGWAGDLSGSHPQAQIPMNDNHVINAFFVTQVEVAANPNHGTVVKSPDQSTYPYGARVTLTASPVKGYAFEAWSDGNTNSVRTFTVTAPLDLTATFEQLPTFSVTAEALGGSGGAVERNPNQTAYPSGTWVTLKAHPEPGYHFQAWLDNNLQNPREILVTSNVVLFAAFAPGAPTSPAIVTPLLNQSVIQNDPVMFTAGASGGTPLRYSWTKDGVTIPGADGPSLHLPLVTERDTGTYAVSVANPSDVAHSSANLVVLPDVFQLSLEVQTNVLSLTLTGSLGHTYAVKGSTELSEWETFAIVTLTNGVWSSSEIMTPISTRFYRATTANPGTP
jgi:hypothetical protein